MTTEANNSHQKHTALIRPNNGDFGRLEIGILGAPCDVIFTYAKLWATSFENKWNVAYVDADHNTELTDQSPFALQFTSKASVKHVALRKDTNSFSNRALFNDQDLIFINSNHFKAQRQIVIVHPAKSIEHKLNEIGNALLILLAGDQKVPDFLKLHLKDNNAPVLALDDEAGISAFFANFFVDNIAPINGLVLAGGKSTRMFTDKGSIAYHGKNQREHTYDMLTELCDKVYISASAESGENIIPDTFTSLGPYGGILSAMQKNPDVAWLTVACDLPYLSIDTLKYLVERRNPSKLATAFVDSDGIFPEPLITIWEPKAYPVLLQFLSQGYSCPRKVLINTDVELHTAPNVAEFKNVNFPAERDEALQFFSAVVNSQADKA